LDDLWVDVRSDLHSAVGVEWIPRVPRPALWRYRWSIWRLLDHQRGAGALRQFLWRHGEAQGIAAPGGIGAGIDQAGPDGGVDAGSTRIEEL